MKRITILGWVGVFSLLLLTGCGRQLPEGGLPTIVPTAAPTVDVTVEPVATEAGTDEASTTEEAVAAVVTTDIATTEDVATTDEAAPAVEATDEATPAAEAADETVAVADVAVTGDAAAGDALFHLFINDVSFACSTCHYVDKEDRLIGPGLLHIAERAATRVEGQTVQEYLRNSILHPSDYVVADYPDLLMPQTYSTVLTEEQINDLIAYLMSL